MRFGRMVHISELLVGDVARMIRDTAGYKPGSMHDFREGYDAMTVVHIDGNYLTFHRPHIEVDGDMHGVSHVQVAVEIVDKVSRDHRGLYYELLALGSNHPIRTGHWEREEN